MVAYSSENDLLVGNIPVPSYINKVTLVQDAADEIDSKLGHIYKTPFDVNASEFSRPAKLLLKRINNFLATGRLILQVAAAGEDDRLHAYGWSLIQEANAALDSIMSGDIPLPGAELLDTGEGPAVTVPLIANVDPESNVEAFYDRVANPNYVYDFLGVYDVDPDRFVR